MLISWTHFEKLGFLSHYNPDKFFFSLVAVISFCRKAEQEIGKLMFSSQSDICCLCFLHKFLLKLPETCRLMETVSSSRGLFAQRGNAFMTAVMPPVSATRTSLFKGTIWQKPGGDL